jgi:hypothetical protein
MWIHCALLDEKIKGEWWKCRPEQPSAVKKACHCNSQFEAGKKLTKLFTKINKLLKQPEWKI